MLKPSQMLYRENTVIAQYDVQNPDGTWGLQSRIAADHVPEQFGPVFAAAPDLLTIAEKLKALEDSTKGKELLVMQRIAELQDIFAANRTTLAKLGVQS